MKKHLLVVAVLSLSTVTIFSQSGVWTQKEDMGGEGRYGACGAAIGNKGYIGVGIGNGFLKDFWEYDAIANTWTQKADFSGGLRAFSTAFSIGSKLYVGMGLSWVGTSTQEAKDFWEYDPLQNKWTQKASYPGLGCQGNIGFSIGGKGYVGTGHYSTKVARDFWEYNPLTDTWKRKADFGGTERFGAVGFSIGNKGYVGTGSGYTGNVKDFWEYDPAINKWSQKADFSGVARLNAVAFSIGEKGYVGTGGSGSGSAYKDFWQYDPGLNQWLQQVDFAGAGYDACVSFNIGNKGYVGTGVAEHNFAKDLWSYTPAESVCSIPSNLNASKITNTAARLSWTITDTNVTNTRIAYRASNDSVWIIKQRNYSKEGINIDGLLPNTTYQWKLRSLCRTDSLYSIWVKGIDFKTLPDISNTIFISPNPVTSNTLTLRIKNIRSTNLLLTISDLQGRTFNKQKIIAVNGSINMTIDVLSLPKGTYVLKISSNTLDIQQAKFYKLH
ncbi:T9SS type A sorting domain-containing protein [Panacibacter sp. DH6]|uniref:T9SS type A sorting domain-containing protein n=1 Tax=Panacibacter microcysteis TaxID=2793269 RepID=A0A931GZ81_9BACT|nr:T9SS type A sorting domain-containing protein [Panacibacter microcysteis]MBG9378089.1 T9SS type A sorting domain-containing protein [Panacibacter microcysteis]